MQPTIPGYLTPIVLVVSVTLAGWLYRVTAEAAGHASLPATTRSRFRLGTGDSWPPGSVSLSWPLDPRQC